MKWLQIYNFSSLSFLIVDLPKVTAFTIQEVTESNVLLNWTGVPGALAYLLAWRLASGNGSSG